MEPVIFSRHFYGNGVVTFGGSEPIIQTFITLIRYYTMYHKVFVVGTIDLILVDVQFVIMVENINYIAYYQEWVIKNIKRYLRFEC